MNEKDFLRPVSLAFAVRLLLAGTALSLIAAGPAAAQTGAPPAGAAPRSFAIPARPLRDALRELMQQGSLQIGFEAADVEGRTSSAVSGSMGVGDALSRLLTGTGLTFRYLTPGSVVLERAPQSSGDAIRLGPVRVEGTASGSGNAGDRFMTGEASATSPMTGYVARRGATGTKTDTPIIETPQSISVVTRDSLEVRAVTNLRDALEYLPGVTTRSYGEDDRYDWSGYRGFARLGTVYRDGLLDGGGIYAQPRTEIYGVERVEFLRGPASVLYGNALPGGLVNVVSKRPTEERRGEIVARLGNRERYALAGDISGPVDASGTVLFRMIGLGEHFNLTNAKSDKNVLYLAPSLTFRSASSSTLTIFGQYQRERINGSAYPHSYEQAWPINLQGIDFSQPGYDHLYRTQKSISYSIDHQLNEHMSLHGRGRYSDIDFDYTPTASGNLNGAIVERTSESLQEKARVWAFDNHVKIGWGFGSGIANETLIGLDWRRINNDFYDGSGAAPSLNLQTGAITGSFTTPELKPWKIGYNRQLGLYVQNQFKFAEQFVLMGGLRRDWYRSDETGSGADPVPAKHEAWTGRLGFVWLHASGLAPYFSYAESFTPEAGIAWDRRRFDPSTGRQYEAGLRFEPQGVNARFSLALFDLRRQNVLTDDPDHKDFSIQTGEITSRGVELEANANLPGGVNLIGSYTYNKVTISQDTDPVRVGLNQSLVPRHKFALWTDYNLPPRWIEGLNVGAGLRWQSKQWDGTNTLIAKATPLLVDARMGYRVGRWDLSVHAQNLLNRRYILSCAYGACYPSNRATVIGSVTYRW